MSGVILHKKNFPGAIAQNIGDGKHWLKNRSEGTLDTFSGSFAHYQKGVGITVTGSGVAVWADQSGNSNDLLQAVDAKRPVFDAINKTLVFDGSNDHLQWSGTLNQPETVIMLFRLVNPASNNRIYDGGPAGSTMQLTMSDALGGLNANAGSNRAFSIPLSTYVVTTVIYDGAIGTLTQVNLDAPTNVGLNIGSNNAAGLTIGSRGSDANHSSIEVVEAVVYDKVLTTSEITGVVTPLMAKIPTN